MIPIPCHGSFSLWPSPTPSLVLLLCWRLVTYRLVKRPNGHGLDQVSVVRPSFVEKISRSFRSTTSRVSPSTPWWHSSSGPHVLQVQPSRHPSTRGSIRSSVLTVSRYPRPDYRFCFVVIYSNVGGVVVDTSSSFTGPLRKKMSQEVTGDYSFGLSWVTFLYLCP